MLVTIIDYGSGNLRSAAKAFERSAREAGIDAEISVTSDAGRVRHADRIVLPGVGAFKDCKTGLDAVPGMVDALEQRVRKDAVPFLGICVGMQLMVSKSTEYGVTEGLNWMEGEVTALEPANRALKIPHMGWNDLVIAADHPVLRGIKSGDHAYFVHSFHVKLKEVANRLAYVDYGTEVTAIIGKDNMIGTQFHPEKSQETGLRLLTNFLEWTPA